VRDHSAPAVTGTPRRLLRAEGALVLLAAVALYGRTGLPWWLLAVLVLVPDIGMAGYARGSRTGAWTYNLLHTEVLPILIGLIGVWVSSAATTGIALIWLAHIGLDRALGYGLKYPVAFQATHLGRIGEQRDRPAPRGHHETARTDLNMP
jgi:hypothetical protein